MITPFHTIIGLLATGTKEGAIGGTLPDIVIAPIAIKDAIKGRIEAPKQVIIVHRLLHSVFVLPLIYLLGGKDMLIGWGLHILVDQFTHEYPAKTHLLYPWKGGENE